MIETTLQFAGLSVVVLLCGVALARSSDRLGERFGWGGSVAGFLLLAGATSLPELILSTQAARIGEAGMAVGDMLGSCLFNLMILGTLDLLLRSGERMLSVKSAAHGLSAMVGVFLAAAVGVGVLIEGGVPLPAWWPATIGPTTPLLLLAYAVGLRIVMLDMAISSPPPAERGVEPGETWKAALFYIGAATVLVLVGPATAEVAVRFAELSGLGGTFVGTTFVAAATSLPEVVTTAAAVRMGAPGMAVGNVLGSNAFNLVILAAVDLLSPGRLLADCGVVHAVTAFWVILVTAAAAVGLLYRAERTVGRIEPDAAAVVLLAAAGFGVVYLLS